MTLPMTLLLALLLTIAIEYGVLLLLGERRKRVLLASIAMNTLTNVPLNLYVQFVSRSVVTIAIGELAVVIVEAACYYWLTGQAGQACVYSLLCNAISFLTGLLFILILSLIY